MYIHIQSRTFPPQKGPMNIYYRRSLNHYYHLKAGVVPQGLAVGDKQRRVWVLTGLGCSELRWGCGW